MSSTHNIALTRNQLIVLGMLALVGADACLDTEDLEHLEEKTGLRAALTPTVDNTDMPDEMVDEVMESLFGVLAAAGKELQR